VDKKMSDIINSLNGSNGAIIAVLLAFIMVCIIIGAKHSLVKIHTTKMDIGKQSSDHERLILQQQADWAYLECMAFEEKIPHNFEGFDQWKCKCMIEQAYSMIVKWILINHIYRNDEKYIRLKQEIMWNMILRGTEHKALRSNSFKAQVDAEVERIIQHLILIREQYTSKTDKGE
jgi:hypothetical protein